MFEWIFHLKMKSQKMESARICSKDADERWRRRETLLLCPGILLCSLFIWVGFCMAHSDAQFVGDRRDEAHRISKRVVSKDYSPFPQARVLHIPVEENKIDNFLTSSPLAESSSSKLSLQTSGGKIPFPSMRPPGQIIFRESNFRFPSDLDKTIRSGRTFPGDPMAAKNNEQLQIAASAPPIVVHVSGPPLPPPNSDSESSRKASPDVQDIIDGIVKLLGGRVHNPQTQPSVSPVQQQNQQQQQQLQLLQQNQQQQILQQNRPYNLFNPNKPIYYTPTAKPTRINNRGPPLPTQLTINPVNQNIHRNPAEPQSAFEAIPLEALNTGFNLTQSKFGPPFPLTQVGHHVPEAPYKQGIPLPQQLVPLPNFPPRPGQDVGTGSESFNHFNTNNMNPPPTSSDSNSNPGNGNGNNGQTTNHNQFYNSATGENYRPNPQHVENHQNQNPQNVNGEKVTPSSSPTQTWPAPSANGNDNIPNHQPVEHHKSHPPPLLVSHNKNPGTIVNYQIHNNQDEGGEQVPSQKFPTISPPSTTTLLVPVTAPVSDKPQNSSNRRKSPIQSQLQTDSFEDDEVDAENEDRKILNNIQNFNETTTTTIGVIEPTITEETQVPTFQLESILTNLPTATIRASSVESDLQSTTKEISFEFSTRQSSETSTSIPTISPDFEIHPTPSTPTTVFSTTTSTTTPINYDNWGFNFSPTSTGSPTPTIYEPVPSRAPAEIRPDGMTRPTPALRPGIVIHEGSPSPTPPIVRPGANQGFGSVEVVSAEGSNPTGQGGKVGQTFDITVTAKQNYGGQVTGQPFVIPVDLKDEIITAPNGNQQFVSIDGKRTYFKLHPSTATGIGVGGQTKTVAELPVIQSTPAIPSHPGIVGAPSHPFAKPAATSKNTNGPSRAVSTSLSISSGSKQNGSSSSSSLSIHGGPISKTPPNLVRRPVTRRPLVQSVRIDTCIVGDDSTCNTEQFEICRTESGVSSCLCRAGYARRRHREPCKAIVALVLSIRLDKLGDKKLSYNADYFNQNSEIYQSLEYETIHGLDSIMSETNLHHGYVGAKLDAVGFDGRHAVVNSTILIQENLKVPINQVTRDLQRQIAQVLTKHRNNFGKSQLWVETPVSAISSVTDVNECDSPDLQDCDEKANCVNTFGSFECKCEFGYGDSFENIPRRSGRKCETCNGKNYCNSRGECQIEEGQKVCKCAGNFYGSQCEIDGEVLLVAIGASVSALVIIGLTLACLCMWSRRWKREEQKAALMSRTLFGGMASQALSYLSKNTMNSSNPYQQHITLDERLRWAQVADSNMNGNIYVSEPLSMHANPGLMGPGSMMDTPPMMSARRSSDTCDTTVDDLFEERHPTKRPKSRSSQLQNGIYYDLEPEPQSEIYGTRAPTIMSYPAQFCVPMNPYPHTRGFYN